MCGTGHQGGVARIAQARGKGREATGGGKGGAGEEGECRRGVMMMITGF